MDAGAPRTSRSTSLSSSRHGSSGRTGRPRPIEMAFHVFAEVGPSGRAVHRDVSNGCAASGVPRKPTLSRKPQDGGAFDTSSDRPEAKVWQRLSRTSRLLNFFAAAPATIRTSSSIGHRALVEGLRLEGTPVVGRRPDSAGGRGAARRDLATAGCHRAAFQPRTEPRAASSPEPESGAIHTGCPQSKTSTSAHDQSRTRSSNVPDGSEKFAQATAVAETPPTWLSDRVLVLEQRHLLGFRDASV